MEIESEVGTIQGDETIGCCVKLRFAIVGDIAFYHTILGRSGGYIWSSMVSSLDNTVELYLSHIA